MTKVVEATGDGACLFNALAIGLGIEILSGRLDSQKDTPGYKKLLDEFATHHPQFNPKSWEHLKYWITYYNNSRDWELILAPVLFNLNQQDQEKLEREVLNELTNFIRDNKEDIEQHVASYLFDFRKCPKIDNLKQADVERLIKNLAPIIKDWDENQDFSAFRDLVSTHAIAQLEDLTRLIKADPNAFQRGYACPELKGMTDALSLTLIENDIDNPTDKNTKIHLENKEQHWNVICSDSDHEQLLHFGPQKLEMTSLEAFQGVKQVPAPPKLELPEDKQEVVSIGAEIIDNPGLGNCAFYAFAIGLINIIQEEYSYNSQSMFNLLVELDESMAGQFDAIINFDFQVPNNELLNQLEITLRLIDFHYRLAELRDACANPADDYAQLVATSSFINFSAIYFNNPLDIDPHFNEFANSDLIQVAIADIDRSRVIENYEHLTLVPLFLSLLYGDSVDPKSITPDTVPSVSSPIIAAMGNVTQEFFWGTHLDLDYLARAFTVNLHTYENDQPIHPFVDIKDRHIITLRNLHNVHWVTEVYIKKIIEESRPHTIQTHLSDSTLPEEINTDNPGIIKTVPPTVIEQLVSEHEIEDSLDTKQTDLTLRGLEQEHSSNTAHEEPPVAAEQVENEENKLTRLKQQILTATQAYTDYSEKNCFFSFFHRHGNAGRVRANKFNEEFAKVTSYSDAKNMLIDYLIDSKNGNTHPHSYRTMLLNELQPAGFKSTLNNTSKNYHELMDELITGFVEASERFNPAK